MTGVVAEKGRESMRASWALLLSSLTWAGCHDEGSSPPGADAGTDAEVLLDSGGNESDAGDERTYVTVTFRAVVGEEEFGCDRTYSGLGTSDAEISMRDLRLFVQDLALVRAEDGEEVPLELDEREGFQRSDVTLLDFENNSGNCVEARGTEETNHTVTGWVPRGSYRGVAFTNGVPEAVNHDNPIELGAPLNAGPLHWTWMQGFLFIDLQVAEVVDTNENDASTDVGEADGGQLGDAGEEEGGVDAPGSVVLHVGSGACSSSSCARPNRNRIVLRDFDPVDDVVVLDVAALIEHLDLRATSTCHTIGGSCAGFFPALGLEFETGAPTSSQTIYSVEAATR
jgi:uncharacterized repeat protein (TIGR04052 family)